MNFFENVNKFTFNYPDRSKLLLFFGILKFISIHLENVWNLCHGYQPVAPMNTNNFRIALSITLLTLLYGCVGGGGDNSDNDVLPPPPSEPGIYIDTASVVEGDSGESSLTFSVTLNTELDGEVTVDWETQDGSADQSDFRASSGTLRIPAGETSGTDSVTVYGDLDPEFTENFDILLSNLINQSSEKVVIGRQSAKALILNDDGLYLDTQPLNDTGMLACEVSDSNNPTVCENKNAYGRQDAHFGRDNDAMQGILYKKGRGWAGFDFTKLNEKGEEVSVNASEWQCVRDNRTGLVWEIKTDDKGLRDRFNTYSWYFGNQQILTGSDEGTANGGSCSGGIDCDTQSYIQAINTMGLCGRNDQWRLPTPEELRSINNYSRGYTTRPTLDTQFFRNDPAIVDSTLYSIGVWSMLSYYPLTGEQPLNRALAFTYQHGNLISAQKSTHGPEKYDKLYIRLVNGS